MAVYTHLTIQEIRTHIAPFRLGRLCSAEGVAAGTVNTIYRIQTTRNRYILRILEDRALRDARFEEALLLHLARAGLAVPRMLPAGRQGHIVSLAPRKHLSVFEYMPGRELRAEEVGRAHARQIGQFLADLHLGTRRLRRRRQNPFSKNAMMAIASRSVAAAAQDPRGIRRDHVEFVAHEIRRYREATSLPGNVAHGDLFIDNARFRRGHLVGVIDFEMAFGGPWLYDLAVAICEWGFLGSRPRMEIASALCQEYASRRPVSAIELRALPALCRFVAARYCMTRIYDFEVNRQPEAQRRYKDYREYLGRLQALCALGASQIQAVVRGHGQSASRPPRAKTPRG